MKSRGESHSSEMSSGRGNVGELPTSLRRCERLSAAMHLNLDILCPSVYSRRTMPYELYSYESFMYFLSLFS